MNHWLCNKCNLISREPDMPATTLHDPYGTGDSPSVDEVYCPCGSDDIEEVLLCDCGNAALIDGFDDCARCILTDQYTHTIEYDDDAYAEARKQMAVIDPHGLQMIDDEIARIVDRGRP